MTTWISTRLVGAYLIGALLACAGAGTAAAAGLQAGEYMCVGSGGKILIGLGFKLQGDGTYTNLNGTKSGHVSYNGSNVSFVGGHLAGQVGNNLRGGTNFQINSIGCSHIR